MEQLIKKLIMSVVLCLLAYIGAFAYHFEVDGIYYDVVSFTDFTCEVVGATDTDSLAIPGKVIYNNRELTVNSIGTGAFQRHDLKYVNISDSIRSIGENAFYYSSLETVVFPNSLNHIGEAAFEGCHLKSITLQNVDVISRYAFENCRSLKSIVINNVKVIGKESFKDCESLESIIISDSLTNIEDLAFHRCTSLTSVTLPETLTYIGDRAFEDCESMRSIKLPDSLTYIGGHVFEGCKTLETIVIPNSVTTVGKAVFYDCTNLSNICLGKGMRNIPDDFLYNCSSLSNLNIPGNIEEIGSFPFDKCTGLIELQIENGEKLRFAKGYSIVFTLNEGIFIVGLPIEKFSIDRDFDSSNNYVGFRQLKEYIMGRHVTMNSVEFSACENLESITCYAPEPPSLYEFSPTIQQYMNVSVFVPDEYLEAYQQDEYWKYFWNLQGFSSVDEISVSGNDKVEVARYNLNGQKVSKDYDGVVIVRFSDGSTKKIFSNNH